MSRSIINYFKSSSLKPIRLETVEDINSNQKDFYNVISDINWYKEFLPWCTKSEILENTRKVHTPTEGEY